MSPHVEDKENDGMEKPLLSNSAKNQKKENSKPSLQEDKKLSHLVKVKVQQRTEGSLDQKTFDSPNIPGFKPIISNR